MTEQGRKQEDISAHKSSRTATTLAPQQLGSPSPSPSLLAFSPHDYSSHHRLYHTMMRPGTIAMAPQMAPPTQTPRPCITSDMGPPIFMPSLNLGTPKVGPLSTSASSSSSALAPPPSANPPIVTSATPTPISAGSTGVVGGALPPPILVQSMSDMILSNAPSVAWSHSLHPFYTTTGMRPGSGQPQYMSIPTGPPQVSAVVSNKRVSVTAAPIAKPTPVQAGHAPKNLGGGATFVKATTAVVGKSTSGSPAPPTNKPGHLTASNQATVSSSSSSSQAVLPSFPPGSSVIKHPLPLPSSQQPQARLTPQSGGYPHIGGGGGGGGGGGVNQPPPKNYPPPSAVATVGKPHANSETAVGPMFFAHHPTMQGHVIPVAYQTMLPAAAPAHGGGVPSGGGGGSVVQPPLHPASSTLSELLAPSSVVASSTLREGGGGGGGGGGKQGKLHDVGVRPYSPGHHPTINRHGPTAAVMRERSVSGDAGSCGVPSPQTASVDTLHHTTTSAQSSTTADHADTRMERPAQPSSSAPVTQQQLPSPQGVPSPYQGPHRERSNSSEVSNIIITVPGLTGRHIAAISSNQPPGYPPPPNNPSSQPLPPPQPQQLPPSSSSSSSSSSYSSSDPFRGSRIKLEYGGPENLSTPLPLHPPPPPHPPHPTTLHIIAQSASNSVGVNARSVSLTPTFGQLTTTVQPSLTATVISSSSSSSSASSVVNSPGAHSHPNSLPLSGGVSGSPMNKLSPSRRPGIIRKRPHESWKMDSPTLNKQSYGPSVQLLSPGHTPRGDNGPPHPSHPLSPPLTTTSSSSSSYYSHNTHPPSPSHLTNHTTASTVTGRGGYESLLAAAAASSPGDIFPSPRKKRRKQDVIVTDDQYASNVPNNIRPEIPMAMDGGDHTPSSVLSPRQQGSAVSMVTRARGRTDDATTPNQREDGIPPVLAPEQPEKVEVQYLSQLRQPQCPINGLYRTHHRSASNHFRRHADIKHIEVEAVSASGIANEKTSLVRATGWKIHHLQPQLEDMLQIERDILEMVKRVETSISNLSQCATCPVSDDVLSGMGEIIMGNVARSNRIISHLETTRNKMTKLLDHKPTVIDLLTKYSTNKRQSPLISASHKLRT